jgi:hypothetical protein
MIQMEQKLLSNRIITENGCWEYDGYSDKDGYKVVWIREEKQNRRVHRVSFALWKCPIDDKMCICHQCDNPACFNPEHLFQDTNAGNVKDRVKKCRSVMGESVHTSIFIESDILKIRALLNDGLPQVEVAKMYNVGRDTIWKIHHRKTWKHI